MDGRHFRAGRGHSAENISDDNLVCQSVWSHIKFDFQEMYSNTAWGRPTSLQDWLCFGHASSTHGVP